MIIIPFKNIKNLCASNGQFIFTSDELNSQDLYHGVVEEVQDPNQPFFDQMIGTSPNFNKILKLKNIHGPLKF